MIPSRNKPFFSVVDVEASGLDVRKSALLQLFATNLPPYVGARPFDPRTLVKPASGYVDPRTGRSIQFTFSKFAQRENVLAAAQKMGVSTEEEAVRGFFASAEEQLAANRRFIFAGWNPQFDVKFLQGVTQRHEGLSAYRGFFQKPGVRVIGLEDPYLQVASMYAKTNPEFAQKYMRMGPSTPINKRLGPGVVASTAEEMRYVPGWSVESITKALGGRERFTAAGQFHEAVTDVAVEEQLFQRFRSSRKLLERGHPFDIALRGAGLLQKGQTAEQFFKQVYTSPWTKFLEKEALSAIPVSASYGFRPMKLSSKTLLIAAAGAVSIALITSSRKDRKSQITGLSDQGEAAGLRHLLTDFRSGWGGDPDRATLKKAAEITAIGGAVLLHKYLLATKANYAEDLYRFFKTVEEQSPLRIMRTFNLSQWASSYLAYNRLGDTGKLGLRFEAKHLFFGKQLTETGQQFKNILGVDPLEKRFEEGMTFIRTRAESPYLELLEAPGYKVRFAQRGRLTGSSYRYGGDLRRTFEQRLFKEKPLARAFEWFNNIREQQYLGSAAGGAEVQVGDELLKFQPLFGERPKAPITNIVQKTERVLFEAAERPLRLFGKMGLGLPKGSYNKLFHIPFAGKGGMLNELFSRRVLPIYLGVTALRYLNYKMDNKPGDALASIPLRAHVAWAEATDKIPGMRAMTDMYANVVPGSQYGPLALPLAGAAAAGLAHYFGIPGIKKGVVTGASYASKGARAAALRSTLGKGTLIGLAAMLPILPGMIGSRKTADELRKIYSGEEEVPIRAGRWWDIGSTPFAGGRIKYFRPHWYSLMKSKAEMVATYGSQDAYWEHHPLVHPITYLKDPYWLENKHMQDRPYPITSPAFTNVPLIGPFLGATVGRVIKPPRRMHEREWDINKYTLYSARLEPRGPGGLPAPTPREEYNLFDVAQREAIAFAEYTGLPGFIAMTLYGKLGYQRTPGADVVLQSSRQMTNYARQYYQRELGAGIAPIPGELSPFGYTEPFRRFIQPDKLAVQANEIPNMMPRWLPGEDYMINFRTGDPFIKIPEGTVRLPGPGYATLHPEVAGLEPSEYPALTKYKILADIAPWSKEYMIYKAQVRKMAQQDTKISIEYERIEDQVRQMKESTVQFGERRFTAPTEKITGTIRRATQQGIELSEYPGRTFSLSSLGTTAADLSAVSLGQNNELTRTQVARDVDKRQADLQAYLSERLGEGTSIQLVVPAGTEEHAKEARAVVFIDDVNINKELIERGLARQRQDFSGAEAQAMHGTMAQALGRYAESVSFQGEEGVFNPLRYLPTPYHTKLWQERTALAQYRMQEEYGSRMRRWDKPIHDIIGPWVRGAVRRLTGISAVPPMTQHRRDLDTMVDELDYLRGYTQAAAHPESRGRYTSQTKRTNIGANLFGAPGFIATTLPRRDKLYFQAFLNETDPEKRRQILQSVSPELARALTAQWVKQDADIARAEGREVPPIEEGGVLYTEAGLEEYNRAKTDLSYSDYIRSKQISEFFGRTGWNIPGPSSALWDENIDYEDVKLKIIQNEGYDLHDFNLYDDRAALLWRKPYVDSAVRELTSGGNQATERIRQTVEKIILEGHEKNPTVMASVQASRTGGSSVRINVDEQPDEEILRDVRRHPEEYREETSF